MLNIPVKDTPTPALIQRGFGDERTDPAAVADCMQLLRVAKTLLAFYYADFADKGISPGKYSVLCVLLEMEDSAPASPSLLAKRIGVSRPAITGLLDGLCKQSFVRRYFSEQDRRKVAIELTPAGRRFICDLLPDQFNLLAETINVLDERERSLLRGALSKLEEHLS